MSIGRLPDEIAQLAPGTPLRDGLDRIVSGHTGALVVLGTNPELEAISTGGFAIDVPFNATRMRELAKMDGAIVLSTDLTRIVAAAVHLSPAADIPTTETGTRHRTAERVAKQVGVPVVTVSASMDTISLFAGAGRQIVPRPDQLLDRVGQALSAIQGNRTRLNASLERLTGLEVHDSVTLRDLAHVAQRFELTNRLADEATSYITAMGGDGRLAALQLRDLVDDLTPVSSLVQRDYVAEQEAMPFARLARLDDQELFDIVLVARSLGFAPELHLDSPMRPRGYRQLASIPRLPARVRGELVERFGDLNGLFAASTAELTTVEGVTADIARQVRDGLTHISEKALAG
ncbi:DNA integrity scanning protein DisA [Propioniciclava sp. MC1683]|uniref:DNA integrity scanning diadenylate cyclase DisA n=1 Tax=Propioniciclava sp. MC1683 TaxID=2760309 RepID=UPI001604062C|nr:DNA integrity scanning diadenylate cyclase DisA [Propioniciclava sp. MC1683]MBB1502145.1 DNA integrity scanning protein DisA [Propioniciclava sp. MC1683]